MDKRKKGIYKVVGGLLAILVVLSIINAMQFARVAASYSYTVSTSNAQIHFIARDQDPTVSGTGTPVLRSAGNDSYTLTLGTWAPRTNKTFTAAFGIVNEERYAITCTNVTVNGNGGDYLYIYLHSNATRTGTASTVITTDDTRRDTGATSSVLMWNGVSGMTGSSWSFAAGDGDPSTYDNDTGDSATCYFQGDWNAGTNNIWFWDDTAGTPAAGMDDSGSNAPAYQGTADYCWVEVCLQIPGDATAQAYSGSISFVFEATVEVT